MGLHPKSLQEGRSLSQTPAETGLASALPFLDVRIRAFRHPKKSESASPASTKTASRRSANDALTVPSSTHSESQRNQHESAPARERGGALSRETDLLRKGNSRDMRPRPLRSRRRHRPRPRSISIEGRRREGQRSTDSSSLLRLSEEIDQSTAPDERTEEQKFAHSRLGDSERFGAIRVHSRQKSHVITFRLDRSRSRSQEILLDANTAKTRIMIIRKRTLRKSPVLYLPWNRFSRPILAFAKHVRRKKAVSSEVFETLNEKSDTRACLTPGYRGTNELCQSRVCLESRSGRNHAEFRPLTSKLYRIGLFLQLSATNGRP